MKTITITTTISGEGISLPALSVSESNTSLTRKELIESEFGSAASNVEVPVVIDISKADFIAIKPTVPISIKTNSTAEPDDTFTVDPTEGYVWYRASGNAPVFTADVEKLYITNDTDGESAASGTVEIIVLDDATP